MTPPSPQASGLPRIAFFSARSSGGPQGGNPIGQLLTPLSAVGLGLTYAGGRVPPQGHVTGQAQPCGVRHGRLWLCCL